MSSKSLTRAQLEAEARSLPREERVILVEALLDSLEDDADIHEAWLVEVRRRAAELDSGEVKAIPADQVFSEIDKLLNE